MATVATTVAKPGMFSRPSAEKGLWSWITTVDHKRIGILYGTTAFIFFLFGGVEALLMRLQLAKPNGTVLSSDTFNTMFTMHGTTMIFLVVMPLSAAFFNYLIPLMIGARDVAFPRLNAFSYWVFLGGGLFLYSSFFLGGAPDAGWFGYAPLTRPEYSLGNGVSFWAVGLQILGVASIAASANFIVTIINLRAPGMSLMRMPAFAWLTLIVSFLLLFAMPIIAIALFEIIFDRHFGTHFFDATAGGLPILWQHLFWLFGHPEVYILILPAMAIVTEIIPVFGRKPLFSYAAVVFSVITIGLMSFGVWAHHMFATGLGAVANAAFSLTTQAISVPTGLLMFAWLATLWGSSLRYKTPLLFSLGFVGMFIFGGLSGVTHAVVPADFQQSDTYYIVAHFHYVLFGGSVFALVAGIYYWFPKVFGRMLSETIGKWHFWIMLLGFNMTFFPMHIVGLQGMPRRIYTYPEGMGWDLWNYVETIGAFTIALSIAIFIVNIVKSIRGGEVAGNDPWDARTLEWSIPSPPPHYNFAEVPVVHARDEFWNRKYAIDEGGRPVRVPAGGAGAYGDTHAHDEHHVHIDMPNPSYWPFVAAIGIVVIAYSTIFAPVGIALGALILLSALFGWQMEPVEE